jgi:FAD/FMN-containing dehydrogenase
LVLGGGWGFSATHAGLTCDSLLESEIILANQQLVTAKAGGPHEDLLWALRGGGGGNFGVNTSFTFRLHEVKKDVTVFNILWPAEKQVELMLRLQDIQLDHSTLISTRSKLVPGKTQVGYQRKDLMVTVLGQYFGTKSEALEALGPVLSLVKPLVADIRQLPYWQARDFLLTDDPNGLYEVRSAYVADRLGEEAIETMIKWMMKWPGGSALPEGMGLLFAIGGKVKELAPEASAYVHRRANYIFLIENIWTPMDSPETMKAHSSWMQGYFQEMKSFLLPRNYVNFPNRDTPNYAQVYYGSNLERLSQIKKNYDPSNLFRFAHSIPLS